MLKYICIGMSHFKAICKGGWFYKRLTASLNSSRAQMASPSQDSSVFSKEVPGVSADFPPLGS